MDFREPPKGKVFNSAFYSKRRPDCEKRDDSKALTERKENLEENIDNYPGSSTPNQNENVSQPSLLSKDDKLSFECKANTPENSNSKISNKTGLEHKLCSKRLSIVSDETASESKDNPSGISTTFIPGEDCPKKHTNLTLLSGRNASDETGLENKTDSLPISNPEESTSERNVILSPSSNFTIPGKSSSKSSPLSPTGVLSPGNVSSNEKSEKTEFFFKLPDKILIRIFEENKNKVRKQENQLPPKYSQNKGYNSQADSTSQIETVVFGGKIGSSLISESTVPEESLSTDTKDSSIRMSASKVPNVTASMRQGIFARKSNSMATSETSMEKDLNSLRLSSSMSTVEAVPENAGLPQICIPVISHEASLTSVFNLSTDLSKESTSRKNSVQKTGSLKPAKGCVLKCSMEFDLILRRRRPSRSKVRENEGKDPNVVSPTSNRSLIAGEESSKNTVSISGTNRLALDEDSLRALNILISESLSSLPELSEKFVRKVKERKQKKAARNRKDSKTPPKVSRRDLPNDSSKPSTSKMSPDSKSSKNGSHSVTKHSFSAKNAKLPTWLTYKNANSLQEDPDTKNASNSRKRVTFPRYILHSSVPSNRILNETKKCTSIQSRIRLFSVGGDPANRPTTSTTCQPINFDRRQLRHANFLTNPLETRKSVEETPMGDNISEVNRHQYQSDSNTAENNTSRENSYETDKETKEN